MPTPSEQNSVLTFWEVKAHGEIKHRMQIIFPGLLIFKSPWRSLITIAILGEKMRFPLFVVLLNLQKRESFAFLKSRWWLFCSPPPHLVSICFCLFVVCLLAGTVVCTLVSKCWCSSNGQGRKALFCSILTYLCFCGFVRENSIDTSFLWPFHPDHLLAHISRRRHWVNSTISHYEQIQYGWEKETEKGELKGTSA